MRYVALVVALAAAFIAGTLVPEARTQEARSTRIATVHYMKVKPGQREDYLRMERNLWKPAHDLLVKQKKMESWSLYEVKPLRSAQISQTSAVTDYDFVTFTVHDESREFAKYEGSALLTVHPDKTLQDIHRRTEETRDTVRQELWTLVDEVQ